MPKLLIVDDEPNEVAALCALLRTKGYDAVGVTGSEAALNAVRSLEFVALLTDLKMPGVDGIALLQAAQAIDSNLIGIVMTGHGTLDSAVAAIRAGAFDFIAKPFNPDVILPALARAMEVRRLRVENAALQQSVRQHLAESEASNKELDAFSYSVSHDLRAPLRAIRGFTQILLEDYAPQLPDDVARLLRNVGAGADRMNQLIEDLLRFARLTRQPLTTQRVKMAALAREILAELQSEQAGRTIEIRIDELPDVRGDPALLRQVLINLLSNAFKFTRRKPTARIEIGSRREERSIVYFVRDNGAGFDMKHAERLFGVFQRLHSEREFEGTGVGLSLVQRIIHRHGGKVWAEAAVEQGATFYFELPA